MSASSFLRAFCNSCLLFNSTSKLALVDSSARWWLRLAPSNSSSRSRSRRSTSARTFVTSSWARTALDSACSRADWHCSSATVASSRSLSSLRLARSSSWTLRPPSLSCATRSLISSERRPFSRWTESCDSIYGWISRFNKKYWTLNTKQRLFEVHPSKVQMSVALSHFWCDLNRLKCYWKILLKYHQFQGCFRGWKWFRKSLIWPNFGANNFCSELFCDMKFYDNR